MRKVVGHVGMIVGGRVRLYVMRKRWGESRFVVGMEFRKRKKRWGFYI
jgi:hypothetical protein